GRAVRPDDDGAVGRLEACHGPLLRGPGVGPLVRGDPRVRRPDEPPRRYRGGGGYEEGGQASPPPAGPGRPGPVPGTGP
ncbi:hypothetical protein THAOC_01477, partial [Thalassiosira oceanica]